MKKPSYPQFADPSGEILPAFGKGQNGFSRKSPASYSPPVQYSDYRDDLTLNEADIIDLDNKQILNPNSDLRNYADDLTLNDADICDLGIPKIPDKESSESIDNLGDYADDLTLNDADIVELDSKYIQTEQNEATNLGDYADDLTLNDADIVEIESRVPLIPARSEAPASGRLPPREAGASPTSAFPSRGLGTRESRGLGTRKTDCRDDLEAYRDDLSLNNADIRDLGSSLPLSGSSDASRDDESAIPDILSDLPAEIIELMCFAEKDKAEICDNEKLMPEIIKEVMGLSDDSQEESLSGIAENRFLSDTESSLPCSDDKTDFLKEQNDLIELTDISSDFIDDNEDTVVNFEKRELKEDHDIIELTDIASPPADDNEDTLDLEGKDEIQGAADPERSREEVSVSEGKKSFLPGSGEQALSLADEFEEESDLSEDIELVAQLINIVVRFPDDDDSEVPDAAREKKKKDLLELLEKDIAEDTETGDSLGDADSGDEGLRQDRDAEAENYETDILRADPEDSDSDKGADRSVEKDRGEMKHSENISNFYFFGETAADDNLMEKDLIDLLEKDSEIPSEILFENRRGIQGDSDNHRPVPLKEAEEIPRTDYAPDPIADSQNLLRNPQEMLTEYLENIVKNIICEKIDQMVIDQQRIVDVIEKAVLKEKNKLIKELTAEG